MSKHKLFFDGLVYSFHNGSWDALVRMVGNELDKQRMVGRKYEQERIIKLLEGIEVGAGRDCWGNFLVPLDETIALIKGEK